MRASGIIKRHCNGDVIHNSDWTYVFKEYEPYTFKGRVIKTINVGNTSDGWRAVYTGSAQNIIINPHKQIDGYKIIELNGCLTKLFRRTSRVHKVTFNNKGYSERCNFMGMFSLITCDILDLHECDFRIHPALISYSCDNCKVIILNYQTYTELYLDGRFEHVIFRDTILAGTPELQKKLGYLTMQAVELKAPDKLEGYLAKLALINEDVHAVLVV